MKIGQIIIFLLILLAVYGSVNTYIFVRGLQAMPRLTWMRAFYIIIFLFLSLSFFAGRITERFGLDILSNILIWTGSVWLGLMIYLLLSVILIDIVRVFNHFMNFFPAAITMNYEKAKLIAAAAAIGTSLIVTTAGYINARIPVVKKIEISIPKKAGDIQSIKIAMASDIHMGKIISNSRLEKLVYIINDLKPDIILLAGDIVDEDLEPVIKNNLGEILRTFKSKYGTYAITGNHEYIGGVEPAVKYLSDHNIIMLRDKVVKIDGAFYVAGREDRSAARSGGRKDLDTLLKGTDSSLPVILMDHQPFNLSEASGKADLQLSGHTHHAQLWPLNFITSAMYEISRGYKKSGDTHYYVSSGYGTWGPPIRTNSRPEIVDITIRFIK